MGSQTKRKYKAEDQVNSGKEPDAKRQRKRGTFVRRNCKGMCYTGPILTSEDREWEDGPSQPPAATVAPTQEDQQPGIRSSSKKTKRETKKWSSKPEKSAEPAEVKKRPSPQEAVQQYLAACKLAQPMPVQSRTWPHLLQGTCVAVQAPGGSGRTLAFLPPGLAKVLATAPPAWPCMLVLVHSREEAQHVAAACAPMRRIAGLKGAGLLEGDDALLQAEVLQSQPHILIAQPQPLLTALQTGCCPTDSLCFVAVAEGDALFQPGLQPLMQQLRRQLLPSRARLAGPVSPERLAASKRQVVIASQAALPAPAAKWLRKGVTVSVQLSATSISPNLHQAVQVCAEHKRPVRLVKLLQAIQDPEQRQRHPPQLLIWVQALETAKEVQALLSGSSMRCGCAGTSPSPAEDESKHVCDSCSAWAPALLPTSTHMRQGLRAPQRDLAEREVLQGFRRGKLQALVALEAFVGRARLPRNVQHVVHYDAPSSPDSYIRSVARTGPVASDGHALTFLSRSHAALAQPLLELLQELGQPVDSSLAQLAAAHQQAVTALQHQL